MNTPDGVRALLRWHRARITPHQVGLRAYSLNRRMPGLSQAEVAVLVGVSLEFYAELESGDLSRASERMLRALAQVLRLDDAQLARLVTFARSADPSERVCAGPELPVRS